MPRKYCAQRIVVFAVYKKFWLMGNVGRYFKVAFPDYKDAEAWVAEQLRDSWNKAEDFMIEEMPAVMKAWQAPA